MWTKKLGESYFSFYINFLAILSYNPTHKTFFLSSMETTTSVTTFKDSYSKVKLISVIQTMTRVAWKRTLVSDWLC